MVTFLDTSVLYSYLDSDALRHHEAVTHFTELAQEGELVTTNYVTVETTALVQRRLGLAATRDLHQDLLPTVALTWVDHATHDAALSALLSGGRRRLSFVDLVSFETMRRLGCDTALSFDSDFADQGFRVLP